MSFIRKMAALQGVAAGQTATGNLPLGATYEILYIYMNVDDSGATDVGHADWGDYLGEIKLMVDGDAKYTMDAADLAAYAKRNGQTLVAGVLPIFLLRPWIMTPNGQDQTSYGTAGGIQTFQIEIDIKSGVTVNKLEVSAQQSQGKPFGAHMAMRKYHLNHGVTGPFEVTELRRSAYNISALHIASAAIEGVEVTINNNQATKTTKPIRAAHDAVYKKAGQSGYTVVDFAPNRIKDAIFMNVQDFRLTLDFTATGNSALYAESIEPA
ncbi:hypothetical protein G5B38_02365 [Pseudohalocynthiibacter aestuariivivens]|nr:major capsid protein P2 [Pseudohalocynthiibacter aestuariivivens]QIE44462.1 hypothetical protein G5B38_02365 [Pseudohalocynthiibacter aestuariivivens]